MWIARVRVRAWYRRRGVDERRGFLDVRCRRGWSFVAVGWLTGSAGKKKVVAEWSEAITVVVVAVEASRIPLVSKEPKKRPRKRGFHCGLSS